MKRYYYVLTLALGMAFTASVESNASCDTQTVGVTEIMKPGVSTDTLTCVITGEIIDRPETTQVMVIEAGKDFRIHPLRSYSPVENGKFSFTISDIIPMAYDILFDDELKRGARRIRQFYSGEGNVKLTYHKESNYDEDRIESNISDNNLAQQLSDMENALILTEQNKLYAIMDSLFECNRAYQPEYKALIDKANSLPPGMERDSITDIISRLNKGPREKCFTKEFMNSEYRLKELFAQVDSLKRSLISENPSIFGLYSIKESITNSSYNTSDWIDASAYIDIFEAVYKYKFSDHPYTSEITDIINALDVKEGNRYPDYKITREDGTTEQIASLIKGNVAVIDLWASWCAPCRRHSKELIPVYEKYKDKGFKLIAIAREDGDCKAMNEAMQKDGYLWESFVDLNDRDKVWRINQAGNGGGKIILVDADGMIVATDVPIKEIEEYLAKTYGE